MVVAKDHAALTDKDDKGEPVYLLGKCDFDSFTIYLKKGMSRSKTQDTLEHELNHACSYPALCGKTTTDEEFVDTISPITLQLKRDNPELMQYLIS